jgi:hypothetical protein
LNETLLTIAEVAVGFAGFASIVTVLGRRRYPQSLQDSLRLRIMLVYSVMVVFLCIIPEILNGYGLPVGTVWRASCGMLALLSSPTSATEHRIVLNLRSEGPKTAAIPRHDRPKSRK